MEYEIAKALAELSETYEFLEDIAELSIARMLGLRITWIIRTSFTKSTNPANHAVTNCESLLKQYKSVVQPNTL